MDSLPDDAVLLCSSARVANQAYTFKNKTIYATQFHPEADGAVFEARINIYKNRGYFPPDSAQQLIDSCHQQDVRFPGQILKNFIDRYR